VNVTEAGSCECGALRRPGDISSRFILVECVKCGLWITPPNKARIEYLTAGGYLMQIDQDDKKASIIVVDGDKKEAVATGEGPDLARAITRLKWDGNPYELLSVKAGDALSRSAHYSPLEGGGPDDIPHQPTGALAQDILKACEGIKLTAINITNIESPDAPSAARGLDYLRQAAPVLAQRARGLSGLIGDCLNFIRNIDRYEVGASEGEYKEGDRLAIIEKAESLGFTDDALEPAEGAPYCPHCLTFMKPWPLQVPDPKSGQTGHIKGHLVKMVTVHAWRCKCGL